MSCSEFVDLVTDYLEGAMDPDMRRRFYEHIELCKGCDTYLEQIRAIIRQSGKLRPEDLSAHARERLLDSFAYWSKG
jgi:anti-sigma factor RsiW